MGEGRGTPTKLQAKQSMASDTASQSCPQPWLIGWQLMTNSLLCVRWCPLPDRSMAVTSSSSSSFCPSTSYTHTPNLIDSTASLTYIHTHSHHVLPPQRPPLDPSSDFPPLDSDPGGRLAPSSLLVRASPNAQGPLASSRRPPDAERVRRCQHAIRNPPSRPIVRGH